MKHLRTICALTIGLMLCATPASATQMTYQKERLILHPSQSTSAEYEAGVLLKVDVRKAGSHSKDWLQLSGYEAGTGLLEISPELAPLHIAPQNMLSPVDVIAFNEFGTVVTIAPNLLLSNLPRPIERGDIVKATLYTQAGFAEKIGLQIGDTVEYKLFKTLPTIVDTTTASPTTETAQAQESEVAKGVANSNLSQKPADVDGQELDARASQAPKRRVPAANPGATPPPPEPLVDTILKRHHQPGAIE